MFFFNFPARFIIETCLPIMIMTMISIKSNYEIETIGEYFCYYLSILLFIIIVAFSFILPVYQYKYRYN